MYLISVLFYKHDTFSFKYNQLKVLNSFGEDFKQSFKPARVILKLKHHATLSCFNITFRINQACTKRINFGKLTTVWKS